MPDVSIIVPIYNAEKYLKKCLDSLVNQSKKELEFILINDGSTDNSEEIIKSYKDKRIKYFKNKNQGIGKTRNFGIEKSTGKYLMFLDSDDYLDTSACEKLYEKAKKEKLDMVVFDFYRVENEKLVPVIIPNFKNSSLKENPNLLLDINLGPCNKLIKREIIVENNTKFLENLKYEDTTFVVETINNSKKIGKLNEFLHYYVIHSNSETTVRDERVFDIIKIVDIIRKYFKNKDYIQETVNKLTVRILTNYTIQQRNQQDKKVGMKFIDEAFAYLKKEVPDYKDNKYYQSRGKLKQTIEKSKTLSKIYCFLYHGLKNFKLNKFLIGLFYFIMTVVFSYITYNVLFHNNHKLINIKPYSLLVTAIIYVVSIILINKLLTKYIKNERKLFITSFIVFILIQLLFAFIFVVVPSWDFGEIFASAINSATGEEPLYKSSYFYIYNNNMGYGLLLSILFSLINLFEINSPVVFGAAGILLNILFIDIAIIYIYKTIRKYLSSEYIKIFILLLLLFTPYITYTPIFYTDTLVLPFAAASIYYLLDVIDKKYTTKKLLFIGLLIGLGYCIKQTMIIILIAFIISYLLVFNKETVKVKLLNILKILIIFIIPIILLNIYVNMNFDQKKLNEKSIPISHWLMMELNDNGGYNQSDVDYTKSFKNKQLKQEANKKVINKRLERLVSNKQVLSFYTNKIKYTWGDGTYYAPQKLSANPRNTYKEKYYILPSNSNQNKMFILLSQTRHILMLLLIIIGCILRTELTEKQKNMQLLLNLSIFGIFIFYLIWETRSRYLVMITPAIILSSFLGIISLNKYLKRKTTS